MSGNCTRGSSSQSGKLGRVGIVGAALGSTLRLPPNEILVGFGGTRLPPSVVILVHVF